MSDSRRPPLPPRRGPATDPVEAGAADTRAPQRRRPLLLIGAGVAALLLAGACLPLALGLVTREPDPAPTEEVPAAVSPRTDVTVDEARAAMQAIVAATIAAAGRGQWSNEQPTVGEIFCGAGATQFFVGGSFTTDPASYNLGRVQPTPVEGDRAAALRIHDAWLALGYLGEPVGLPSGGLVATSDFALPPASPLIALQLVQNSMSVDLQVTGDCIAEPQ